MKKGKHILWGLITLLLAVLSVAAVLSQSKNLSVSDLFTTLGQANPFWLLLSFAASIGYIAFEALAIMYLLRSCGYSRPYSRSLEYSAADIYCAAITPSASGGQPVIAWFMKRDGIPMGYITAVLAMYLIMHTFATLALAFATLLTAFPSFLSLSVLSKLLVILGYLTMTGLGVVFLFLMRGQARILQIGWKIIDWLYGKGIVKRRQHWRDRLESAISDYSAGIDMMRGRSRLLLGIFGFNLLQRLSQTIVSTLMFLAVGGDLSHAGRVFSTQIYTSMGSMCLPVPGGMGVADYLLYDGLSSFMEREAALQLELLSRSTSFYLCVLISLVIVVIGYLRRKRFYISLRRH